MALRGVPASYAVVTATFTLLIVALVIGWREGGDQATANLPPSRSAAVVAGIVAGAIVMLAAYRWMRLAAWLPYHADMLIVIREATRRFLNGQMPYATYRSYDTTWEMVMPYGPALWGPFVIPQLSRLDFRIISVVGELFVPIWCGVAGIVEAVRGRIIAAVSWLVLLTAVVLALDAQRFTLIAHTPVYWLLFLPLAATIQQRRWSQAAVLLGLLVAARQTMVSMIPVFLIAIWLTDRRDVFRAVAIVTLTIGVMFLPFVIWDASAVWEAMVLSYPRVMKSAVWPVLARPGLETIGITEWLIERHHEWLVTPVQLSALGCVYAAAWAALGRGRRGDGAGTEGGRRGDGAGTEGGRRSGARSPLPWMALALFVFSMTTLYPVHYLYYDVLLLLACGRVAETLATGPAGRTSVHMAVTPKTWTLSLAGATIVVLIALRTVASPLPSIAAGQPSEDRPLRFGFAASESDGSRNFAWIVGHEARILLPRSSASSADIVLVAQSPFRDDQPPQRMSAILNGTLLTEATLPPGWQEIRIPAPRQAWWIGFNELRLNFSSTVSPREASSGTDGRPLALGLSRVDLKMK
jgi:hypothetical protein